MAGMRERTAVMTSVEIAKRSDGRFRPWDGRVRRWHDWRRDNTGDDEGDIDALPAGQAVWGQIRVELSKVTSRRAWKPAIDGRIRKETTTRVPEGRLWAKAD